MTAAPSEAYLADTEPVSLGMELLADRVSLLVLRDIFRGSHRYQQFKDDLQISNAVLTDRLRHLEDAGLVATRQYNDHPPRFEYVLTDKGSAYWPVAISLWRWETLWTRDESVTLPSLHHHGCDGAMLPWFGCSECGEQVWIHSSVEVGASNEALFDALSRTPHRYRRAGSRTQMAFSSRSSEGVFTVLRDRWTLLIMLAFVKGLGRFTEIQRSLNISPTVLSRHLDEMTANGLIEPVAVPGRSHRTYRLLPKGVDLRPALVFTHLWANEWAHTGPRDDMVLHHAGHPLAPAWFCEVCSQPIDIDSAYAGGIPEYDRLRRTQPR